jgi:hypothetical protein
MDMFKIEGSLTLACSVEVIGFIGRIVSGKESPNWTLGPYIIQAILLLVAPVIHFAIISNAFLWC